MNIKDKLKICINANHSAIKEEIFKELKDSFLGKNDDEKLSLARHYFEVICELLSEFNLLNANSVNEVIEAINRAMTYDDEQYLYKIMYERDKLKKQIQTQKDQIKTLIAKNYQNVENFINNSDLAQKNELSLSLKDRLLNDLEMLGILKETAESAFLNTIEACNDVEDTSYEIAKNIVYRTINDGEFIKGRFLGISSTVIESAANIANESKIYAKELIIGAINGSNDGISKAIEKFKDELRFVPNDLENSLLTTKEIIKIEDDFIDMLRQLASRVKEPSNKIINEILQSEYDNYFAMLKRISAEAREQIFLKIDEIGHKSSKIKEDLNLDEKINALKKELSELEKKAGEKLSYIKPNYILQNAKTEAKKLGDRFYEVAKNLIEKKWGCPR